MPSLLQTKVVFFDIGDTLVSKKKWLSGAKELISHLKSKRIRIGLISNTGNLSRDELEKLLPSDFEFELFEEGLVLLSSEVGVEKPDLSIFLLAIQHATVSPWETLFVGESLTEVLAAQNSGMHAIRICDPASDFVKLKECF
jgi:putative hydrolase of the HAD superfamily